MLIRNARALIGSDWADKADILIEDGRIAQVGETFSIPDSEKRCWNAEGLLLLPGIVDLHGDAFERQIMPRPGVHFPIDLALMETDRQLVANGITTAFHGLTCSWEPGLRSTENAERWLAAFDAVKDRLHCDTRVHLRHEIYNTDAEKLILDWIKGGKVGLIGFNDHLPLYLDQTDRHGKKAGAAARAGMSKEDFEALVLKVRGKSLQVPASVERLARAAAVAGIESASHDDETPEIRRHYASLGSRLCEFPLNAQTARTALEDGGHVIMGAPNILRGGSHAGRLGAAQMIKDGLCSILTSDYYYPALLQSVFLLDRDGILPLNQGWSFVSANPAEAAGLHDRGEIAPGRRADLILIAPDAKSPSIVAVMVAGKMVYLADPTHRLAA